MSVAEAETPSDEVPCAAPTKTELAAAAMAMLDRTPATPEAEDLIGHLAELLLAHEAKAKPRGRARTAIAAKNHRRAVAAFVADLLCAPPGRFIYRSTQANSFTGSAVAYRQFLAVLDGMKDLGWVEHVPGFRAVQSIDWGEGVVSDLNKGKAARFRAPPQLLTLAAEYGVRPAEARDHFYQPLPEKVIVLKAGSRRSGRSKVGRVMPVPECAEAEACAEVVRRINAFLAEVRIEGGRHESLFRQFELGDQPGFAWNKGGRLYSAGKGNYQTAKEEERLKMTLNGEPVAEIDVRASYLTVLHGITGRPMPEGDDPYTISGFDRDAVKVWVTATLGNGRPIRRWPSKANQEFQKNKGRPLSSVHRAPAVEFAVTAKFPVIRDLEALGVSWADLMFVESEAIIGTMVALMETGVPSLPVHDSLLTPRSAVPMAIELLKANYRSVTGMEPMLTVEMKDPVDGL